MLMTIMYLKTWCYNKMFITQLLKITVIIDIMQYSRGIKYT